MKLSISQKSREGQLHYIDDYASLQKFEDSYRIVYAEKNGAIVTLNFGMDEAQLVRKDEWVTYGDFSLKRQSKIDVINEHGTMTFEVDVLKLTFDCNSFTMQYRILQFGEFIDEHEFKCIWEPEV